MLSIGVVDGKSRIASCDRHLSSKAKLAVARTPLAIDLFPAGRFVTQALAERGEHTETTPYGTSAVDPMNVVQDALL